MQDGKRRLHAGGVASQCRLLVWIRWPGLRVGDAQADPAGTLRASFSGMGGGERGGRWAHCAPALAEAAPSALDGADAPLAGGALAPCTAGLLVLPPFLSTGAAAACRACAHRPRRPAEPAATPQGALPACLPAGRAAAAPPPRPLPLGYHAAYVLVYGDLYDVGRVLGRPAYVL